jgi:hypothetical protein
MTIRSPACILTSAVLVFSVQLQGRKVNAIRRNHLSIQIGNILNTATKTSAKFASNAIKAALGRNQIGTNVVIERFVGSLLNGSQPPVTAEEGREAVRIMEMVVARYHEKYPEALGEK